MIADKIKKETSATERGLSYGSHFEVEFDDNSTRHEQDTSWREMSEEREVEFLGEKKTVRVSAHPIKKIRITHGELSTEIVVPKDCEAYQSIRSETVFMNEGQRVDRVLGRIVGLVKNGKIVEERYLDARTGEIVGFRE